MNPELNGLRALIASPTIHTIDTTLGDEMTIKANEPYRTEVAELQGWLAAETVGMVHVPRRVLLELLEKAIDQSAYDISGYAEDDPNRDQLVERLRAELLPVARTMPRFPLSQWLDSRRGCGCVVGEYLVATGEIERHNAAMAQLYDEQGREALPSEFQERVINFMRVDRQLDQMGDWGHALYTVGLKIDTLLRYEVTTNIGYLRLSELTAGEHGDRDVVVVFDDAL